MLQQFLYCCVLIHWRAIYINSVWFFSFWVHLIVLPYHWLLTVIKLNWCDQWHRNTTAFRILLEIAMLLIQSEMLQSRNHPLLHNGSANKYPWKPTGMEQYQNCGSVWFIYSPCLSNTLLANWRRFHYNGYRRPIDELFSVVAYIRSFRTYKREFIREFNSFIRNRILKAV
jgi:hypothetical protein